ncbi:MAG: hypothetical protein P4L73_19245 [Caulobacteraceae bacterium]|nr:hypothetical protein [Caulobacteraceae bacterium]
MANDITAVVQRGRSVWMHEGSITVGKGDKARQIPVEDQQVAMPGDKITLPARDMQPLIDHGFVKIEVNPELPKSVTEGPKVIQEGENAPKVTIEVAAGAAE